MKTGNKVAEAFAWLVLSTFFIGFALLSDGMAGGKVSSISGLWHDLVTLNPAFLVRAVWWLMVLLPVALLLIMVRRWRRKTDKPHKG